MMRPVLLCMSPRAKGVASFDAVADWSGSLTHQTVSEWAYPRLGVRIARLPSSLSVRPDQVQIINDPCGRCPRVPPPTLSF
jgi:hypothetical protein